MIGSETREKWTSGAEGFRRSLGASIHNFTPKYNFERKFFLNPKVTKRRQPLPELKKILLGTDSSSNRLFASPEDRATHMHVIGASGMGKSYFLQSMIQQDIEHGHGLCLIDPHGELYENLVKYCAGRPDLHKRVVLFNPSDYDSHVVGFNPLAPSDYFPDINVQVDYFISCIKKVMDQQEASQPQLESTLRNILLPLIRGGYSFLEIEHFFNYHDEERLMFMARQAGDETVITFWRSFLKQRDKESRIGSTQRRADKFRHNEAIRLSLGQTQRTLDFRDIIENRKILLVNLGLRGNYISRENADLLGVMLLNELTSYGKTRDWGPAKEKPFYIYLDEFQNFVTSDITEILSGGRKFGLHLILSHQDLFQLGDLEDEITNAVLSTRGRVVFGGLSSESAKIVESNIGLFHDLLKIKYEDKHTAFEPYNTLETLKNVGHSSQQGKTSGTAVSSSRGARSGESRNYDEQGSPTTKSTNSQRMDQTGNTSNQSVTNTQSQTETYSQAYVTRHKKYVEKTKHMWSLDELQWKNVVELIKQPPRTATIQMGRNSEPVKIVTPDVNLPTISRKQFYEFKQLVYWSHSCYLPTRKAQLRIERREAEFKQTCTQLPSQIRGIASDGEHSEIREIPFKKKPKKLTTT